MKRKTKSRIAFAVAALLLAACAVLVGLYLHMGDAAKAPDPSPEAEEAAPVEEDGELFPYIDWDYWLGVNPDVIGWVTVPGTGINHPIVQAHADDPTYYLTHDVYRNWNIYGCPYLDYTCAEKKFESPNAVVFGHNMTDGTMFEPFAGYSDLAFAKEHQTILLQTPDSRQVLLARFADVVPGWDAEKRTEFLDETDYRAWYREMRSGADAVLDAETEPSHVVTFCTCSYNFWADNERTLVFASPAIDDDIWAEADTGDKAAE